MAMRKNDTADWPTGRTTLVTDPQAAHEIPAVPMSADADNPDAKPETLSERIMAAQERIARTTAPARAKASDQAKAAAGSARRFVTDHPVLAVTGALAVGAAIAFALPGRPGRKMRGGAVALGGLVAELAATYGTKMLSMAEEAAQASQEKLDEIGDTFASASETIADTAAETGSTVLESVKKASEATAGQAQSLARKIKR